MLNELDKELERRGHEKGLDGFFDSVLESLKYFKEAAKNHYWSAAFMFYQATEEIRKSGTSMPNYIDMYVERSGIAEEQANEVLDVIDHIGLARIE